MTPFDQSPQGYGGGYGYGGGMQQMGGGMQQMAPFMQMISMLMQNPQFMQMFGGGGMFGGGSMIPQGMNPQQQNQFAAHHMFNPQGQQPQAAGMQMGSMDAPGTTPQMVQDYNAQFGVGQGGGGAAMGKPFDLQKPSAASGFNAGMPMQGQAPGLMKPQQKMGTPSGMFAFE